MTNTPTHIDETEVFTPLVPDLRSAGFIGVSVCSHFFSNRRVSNIIRWANQRFDRFLFLIADAPQAYTFMATRNLSYAEAMAKAMQIGDEHSVSIRRQIDNVGWADCRVMRWHDISGDAIFQSHLAQFEKLFRDDPSFHRDVCDQVHLRNEGLLDDSELPRIPESQIEIAAKYVIHELTAMRFLQTAAKPSWPTQVFPLAMPVALAGLYEKKYGTEVSLDKTMTGYIQISVKDAD